MNAKITDEQYTTEKNIYTIIVVIIIATQCLCLSHIFLALKLKLG